MENSGENNKTPQYTSVGGINYLDKSHSYDLLEKYGVDENIFNPLWQVLKEIQSKSIKEDPEVLNGGQKLIQYISKISPAQNVDLLSEYIAIEQSLIIQKYHMPNPALYIGEDENNFLQALYDNADRKMVNIVDTPEKIKQFDTTNNSHIAKYFIDHPKNQGVFFPKYKNAVFIKPGIINLSSVIGHEMIHQAQNKWKLDNHGGVILPEEEEFEAYIYGLIGDEYLCGDIKKAETDEYIKSIFNKIVGGMQASIQDQYQDQNQKPNYLK